MNDSDRLLARVVELEDRSDLSSLAIKYGAALDASDVEMLGTLFSADGIYVDLDGLSHVGQEKIVAFLVGRATSLYRERHHLSPTQHTLTLNRPLATGHVSCLTVLIDKDRASHSMLSTYDDDYVCEDGQWKFACRVVHHSTDF